MGAHRSPPVSRQRSRGLVAAAVLGVIAICAGVIIASSRLSADDVAQHGRPTTVDRSDGPSRPVDPGPTYRVTASAAVPAGSARPQRPTRITLPDGVSVSIEPVGTQPDGNLEAPADITVAGWWDSGSRIGDPFGAIVVAAHVDSRAQGLGPFSSLLSARAGDRIRLLSAQLRQDFKIARIQLVAKTDLAGLASAFSVQGRGRLVLITCAGPYEPSNGGYQNVVVITASPSGVPGRR